MFLSPWHRRRAKPLTNFWSEYENKLFNVPDRENQVTLQQKPGFATEIGLLHVNPPASATPTVAAEAPEKPLPPSTEPPTPEVSVPGPCSQC